MINVVRAYDIVQRAYQQLRYFEYVNSICTSCGLSNTQGHHKICKVAPLLEDMQELHNGLYLDAQATLLTAPVQIVQAALTEHAAQVEPSRIVIPMSVTAPLSIAEKDWPSIVSVFKHDGVALESQANSTWGIEIRKNSDGRYIVYGEHNTRQQRAMKIGHGNQDTTSSGYIVQKGEDVVAYIRCLAVDLHMRTADVLACIQALPPIRID